MMANTEVGSAYVSIFAKVSKSFARDVNGAVQSAGKAIGSLATKAAAVTAAAGTAAAAGAAAVGKMALDAYGDFEQLSGGAELMFGDAYDYIMQRSQEAYKSVQMSQNDYLQQVNGFAVGLRESLGGDEQAAAELADKIITAEADIVSATGNTQENVQNALNGIMKGNYTMLDNLQLGIKPTKEGMQEVIDKVNEWNAAQGRASDYTIDSLADCEAAVVDYVDMVGMSGYAQKEAAGTIQGSMAMVKASWQNLLTEMGKDDGDVGARVTELVESAKTALFGSLDEESGEMVGGIIPRVTQIVQSVADEMPEIMPLVTQAVSECAPLLAEAGASIGKAVMDGIGEALLEEFPQLGELQDAFGQAVGALGGLWGALQEVGDAWGVAVGPMQDFAGALQELAGGFLEGAGEELQDTLVPALENLKEASEDLAPKFAGLLDAITPVMEEGGPLAEMLGGALVDALALVVDGITAAVDIMGELCDGISAVVEACEDANDALGGLPGKVVGAFLPAPGRVSSLFSSVTRSATGASRSSGAAFTGIGGRIAAQFGPAFTGAAQRFESMKSSAGEAASTVRGKFEGIGGKIAEEFSSVVESVQGTWDSLTGAASAIPGKIVGYFTNLGKDVSDAIGSIHFPQPTVTWGSESREGVSLPLPHVSWNAGGALFRANHPVVLQGFGDNRRYDELALPLSPSLLAQVGRGIAQASGLGGQEGMTVNLNYQAGADANQMVRDIARGVGMLRATGAM